MLGGNWFQQPQEPVLGGQPPPGRCERAGGAARSAVAALPPATLSKSNNEHFCCCAKNHPGNKASCCWAMKVKKQRHYPARPPPQASSVMPAPQDPPPHPHTKGVCSEEGLPSRRGTQGAPPSSPSSRPKPHPLLLGLGWAGGLANTHLAACDPHPPQGPRRTDPGLLVGCPPPTDSGAPEAGSPWQAPRGGFP